MDSAVYFRRSGRTFFALALGLVASAVLAGCQQTEARAEKNLEASDAGALEPENTQPLEAEKPAATTASGQQRYQEEAFDVSLLAPSELGAQKPLSFTVKLTAKSGYKVNDEYPIKFVVESTPGVTAAKQKVTREDATIDKKSAQLPVVVTLEGPGPHRIAGRLSFSVCTDERCLIEKRDLSLSVAL